MSDGREPRPQEAEDLMLVLTAFRFLADSCSETTAIFRASAHAETVDMPTINVGDWVLVWYPHRTGDSKFNELYRGPYVVLENLGGDFWRVGEVLAGDAQGTPTDVHASRFHLYDKSRSSGDIEHARKLPTGYAVVKAVLDGPRESDGRFQVQWAHQEDPTWEPPDVLRSVIYFRNYCDAHDLTYDGVVRARTERREAATLELASAATVAASATPATDPKTSSAPSRRTSSRNPKVRVDIGRVGGGGGAK